MIISRYRQTDTFRYSLGAHLTFYMFRFAKFWLKFQHLQREGQLMSGEKLGASAKFEFLIKYLERNNLADSIFITRRQYISAFIIR